jgi:hypothetical protein
MGSSDATSYDVSEFQSNQESEKLTWWDYTRTSLDLTGALLETTVGVLASETGIGAVAAVDGGTRVAGNFTKLIVMIETGKKSELPTNAGAIVGNVIDQISGNSHGQAQAVLGFGNDLGTLFVHPESSYKILNMSDNLINGNGSPLTLYNLSEGVYSSYESLK